MTKYEEIIENIKRVDAEQAEEMEEKIDVLLHKLKFLPADSFPNVVILNQSNNFNPLFDPILVEKVKIAGGTLNAALDPNTQIIIFLQQDESLYNDLPATLINLKQQKIRALIENKVFILQNSSFQNEDDEYIRNVETLAEIIQPKYFYFGHEGLTWFKFETQ